MFWIMLLSSLRIALAETPVAADLKSCSSGHRSGKRER